MADTTAIVLDSSTMAAMSGAAAAVAAGAARYRRTQDAYFRGSRSNSNAIDTASYMNHLRAPAPTRIPTNRGGGVHIHYQNRCPHGAAHGLSYHDGHLASYGENGGYFSPQGGRKSQYTSHAVYHNSPCGCSQCYWKDFLTNDIEKYKTARKQLRETYVWNLRELVRRHRTSPTKSRVEKDSELEKLYWYYVGRVREIYDNHCQHHRLLFRDVCLAWEIPEKVTLSEESVIPISRVPTPLSRRSSGSLRTPIPSSSRVPTPLSMRGSGNRWSMDAAWVSKGKEKEVIPSADGEVSMPIRSVSNDGKNKGKGKEETITPPMTTSSDIIPRSQPKPNKVSMQQRLRLFWPTRIRGKSLDKVELVQETRTEGEKHEENEQEVVV
ncbi:hypothetical protein GGS24DRAFT_516042 [Hypoxylon argillaceum]|nr:hypothetical protein GGS24DRAFT_516042 [Hypoxylon argillaceum]